MSEQANYSEQIEKLGPKKGDLLTISVPFPLAQEQRDKLREQIKPIIERLGCEVVVLGNGMTAQLHRDSSDRLAKAMEDQAKAIDGLVQSSIQILDYLVDQATDDNPDAPPERYLDGTPCR